MRQLNSITNMYRSMNIKLGITLMLFLMITASASAFSTVKGDIVDTETGNYFLKTASNPCLNGVGGEYSYLICTDGVNYFSKNGTTGNLFANDTNATYVIQSVFDATQIGGKIIINSGDFIVGNITISKQLLIEGMGWSTNLSANAANVNITTSGLIDNNGGSIKNIKFDCNNYNNTIGLKIWKSYRGSYDNIQVVNCKIAGIYLKDTYMNSLNNMVVQGNMGEGFISDGANANVWTAITSEGNGHGGKILSGNGNVFNGGTVEGNYNGGLDIFGDTNTFNNLYTETNNVSGGSSPTYDYYIYGAGYNHIIDPYVGGSTAPYAPTTNAIYIASNSWFTSLTGGRTYHEAGYNATYIGLDEAYMGLIASMLYDNGTIHNSGDISISNLVLRGGDSNDGFYNSIQIVFGYHGTDHYPSFIRTRHFTNPENNSIDFYTGDGTSNGVFPTNAIHGLSISNGSITTGHVNGALVSSENVTTKQMILQNGDANDGSFNVTQIIFGYHGTSDFPHRVTSRHDATISENNLLNISTYNPDQPTGNGTIGLSIRNGNITVPGGYINGYQISQIHNGTIQTEIQELFTGNGAQYSFKVNSSYPTILLNSDFVSLAGTQLYSGWDYNVTNSNMNITLNSAPSAGQKLFVRYING